MSSHPIELILLKQWASYIAIPMWITDAAGNLVFYNEPAEPILGHRFEEAGEIHADDLADTYTTRDLDDSPLLAKELPIVVALVEGVPAHRKLKIRGLDGEWRTIEITALPILGEGMRLVGALATFWEEH